MYVLTAAVIVLAALVLLNMSVTAAMVRRLGRVEESRQPPDPGGLPVGARVPEFEATALSGDVLTSAALAGRHTVVAFYSTSCEGCRVQAPGFAAEADRLAAEGKQVLSVLMMTGANRDGAGSEDLRDLLAGMGPLVVEDGVGALTASFAARATPSYFAVGPDQRITGKGLTLAECLAGSPA